MKLAVLVTILCLDDKKNNKWLLVDWEIPYLRAPVCYTIYYPHLSLAQHETSFRKLIKSQDIYE